MEEKGRVTEKPKRTGTTGKNYIKPVAENFKRTQNEDFLVRQGGTRLLEEQSRIFPAKPMLTVDRTEVRFSDNGKPGVGKPGVVKLVQLQWQ